MICSYLLMSKNSLRDIPDIFVRGTITGMGKGKKHSQAEIMGRRETRIQVTS